MSNIKKIENFMDESNKSLFGLPLKKFFVVNDEFNIEFIIKYEKVNNQGPYTRLTEEWEKCKVKKGDYLFTSEKDCFLIVDDQNNYIKCRPESQSASSEEPDFRKFDSTKIKEIGPTEKIGYSIPFNKREEIFIERGL